MSQEPSRSPPEPQPPQSAAGSVDPQSVEGLFLAALAMPDVDQRRVFLDEACLDAEQRRRVEALLRAYHDAGSFLEAPAAGHEGAPHGVDEPLPDEVPLDFLHPSDQPGCLGTLGPYQIIDVIGRGGMGIVLRALDTKLNRIVAVKVLAPDLAANPNARRRFLREAQAAAAVSHPHVVTIHAVDEDQLPYLVMECVVGQSLQEKLDRAGALRLTEILRIGRQVAEGLAAAHEQGLIHRDIKPANILLENGVERVKITDFGLARAVDDVAITRTGEVSGTPQYMSPEQARGEHVDQRSDLFSLGCVLYAMCTGRSPFRGDSLAAVIKRVTEDNPRSIAEVNSEIPAWLSDVIQRLLEKHPDQRFQTAAEVSEVLAGHLANVQQPTRSTPPPRPEPQRTMRRLPLLIARVVGYVVLAAIGCVVAMGSVWAPTVSFLAVLFLTPLSWVAIWRGKRDGRRPWCNLSYTEPAVAAVAFLVGIQRGISITGSDAVSRGTPTSGIVALSGIAALMIAGIVTLTLILALGGRRSHREQPVQGSRAPVALVSPAQSRPQRILVWLAILCLTMFLLVPICAVGIGLLVPLLARQKAPVTKKALTNDLIRQWQQAAAEQQPTVVSTDLPLGVRWETEPGVNTMFEGKVQLDVLLLSEGMFVALRRSSSFNGSQAGDEHLATSIGTTSLKLQPGEYDVLVRDGRFGWGVGNRGRIVVREGGLGTLTVQRDLSSSVKPFQDFNTTTGSAAQFVGSAAEEHFGFLWNGQRHELTRWQSSAVQKLAAALVSGQPDVADADIVTSINVVWRHGDTLEQNFHSPDGPVAAWGKLVVPGAAPGTFRLAPIPQAMLTIHLQTLGMQADVLFPQEVGGGSIFFRDMGQHCLTVRPGTYHVRLIDSQVHWIDQSSFSPMTIPSRTEQLVLDDGAATNFAAERRWQDYVIPKYSSQPDAPMDPEARYRLVWFGHGNNSDWSGFQIFTLTPPQAAFVSRLFQGLADGKPDVSEDELLKAAGATSMSDLFPGSDGKTAAEVWGSLFVRDDQPNTWRLNVPTPAGTSPRTDAAATDGLPPDSPSDDEIHKN